MLGKRLPSDLLSPETQNAAEDKWTLGDSTSTKATENSPRNSFKSTGPNTPFQPFVSLSADIDDFMLEPNQPTQFDQGRSDVYFGQNHGKKAQNLQNLADTWDASSPITNRWNPNAHQTTIEVYTQQQPNKIWKGSMSRLTTCASEDCLLMTSVRRLGQIRLSSEFGVVFQFMREKTASKQKGSLLKNLPL